MEDAPIQPYAQSFRALHPSPARKLLRPDRIKPDPVTCLQVDGGIVRRIK